MKLPQRKKVPQKEKKRVKKLKKKFLEAAIGSQK